MTVSLAQMTHFREDPESFHNRNYIICQLRSQGKTLEYIGQKFGISRERVRQLTKGIEKPPAPPKPKKRLPPEVAFWKHVIIGDPDKCWEWQGSFTNGYGRYHRTYAHKFCFEITYGPLPEGKKWVCHTCDNSKCVNPLHLYPGDPKDNARDRETRNRGDHHKRLAPSVVWAIKQDLEIMNCCQVARKYKMPYTNIHNIKSGKAYRWVVSYPDGSMPDVPVRVTRSGKRIVIKPEDYK